MRKLVVLTFIALVALGFGAASPELASATSQGQSLHEVTHTDAASAQRAYDQSQIALFAGKAHAASQERTEIAAFGVRNAPIASGLAKSSGDTHELRQAPVEVFGEVIADDTTDDDVLFKSTAGGVYSLVVSTMIVLALGFIFSSATIRYHTRR